MSTDYSCCRFPYCDSMCFISLTFKYKHICKGCDHDIDLLASNVNFCSNTSFATSPSVPISQYYYVKTDSNPAPTCQGPPTLHHNIFLPRRARDTEEIVVSSATTNLYLMKLIQGFAPCDRPKNN